MTVDAPIRPQAAVTRQRKPRIALMGEFSAGKSTLANLLTRSSVSPTRATATQLPPIWYSYGTAEPYRLDREGNRHPLSVETLVDVSHRDTSYIRVFVDSPVLTRCDLVDMPGLSDPNMAGEAWSDVVEQCDGVIWCTPATQAWRQSEAAAWEGLPDRLRANAILLITRIDKILGERDRSRVVSRVSNEVAGAFRAVLPISLTQALAAHGDPSAPPDCGAVTLHVNVRNLIADLEAASARADDLPSGVVPLPSAAAAPGAQARGARTDADTRISGHVSPRSAAAVIVPRRVAPPAGGGSRTARPKA